MQTFNLARDNYTAELVEHPTYCTETVKVDGATIHHASFPTRFLGKASRADYLGATLATIMHAHKRGNLAELQARFAEESGE